MLILCLLATAAPAHADGWLLTFSSPSGPTGTLAFNNGTANPTSITWTAPSPTTGALTVPGYDVGSGTGCGPLQTCSVDANAALTFTISATWQGASPPPPSVILTETSLAGYSGSAGSGITNTGSAADGLNDPVTLTSSGGVSMTSASGTPAHYSIQAGSNWQITRTLIAHGYASATAPGNSGIGVGMGVHLGQYSLSTLPVAINLSGAILDSSGNLDILVGQPCTASLSGLPSIAGATVTYAWTVSGTTFQTWSSDTPAIGDDPYNADASYYVDGPGPLTNSTAGWYWNDISSIPTTETVSCNATVTPPAGQGNAFTVTATQSVTVFRPNWTATGTGGNMQVNTAHPAGNGTDYWLYAGPLAGTGETGGMDWRASVAPPLGTTFGAGSLEIVQLVMPNRSYTDRDFWQVSSTHSWTLNGQEGLDTSYPYPWVTGTSPYFSGDLPGLDLTAFQAQSENQGRSFESANVDDQFEDYLMYFAPASTQCVPLAHLVWRTSGSATIPSTNNWANYGTGSAGAVTPSGTAIPFGPSNAFLMWTLIVTADDGHV